MTPKGPKSVYQKTAQRLNLPEEYVQALVEFYYAENKSKMFSIAAPIINFSGLGRFVIRPKIFYDRIKGLQYLIEKFSLRKDNRGIMIRKELESRLENFAAAYDEVELLSKKRYGRTYKNRVEKPV